MRCISRTILVGVKSHFGRFHVLDLILATALVISFGIVFAPTYHIHQKEDEKSYSGNEKRVNSSSPDGKAHPAIERIENLDPIIYDNESPVVTADIDVTNTTRDVVRFTGITKSCSCTSATIKKMELMPGEKTVLQTKINVRGKSGPQAVRINLLNDAGIFWSYVVKVMVYPRVQFNPSILVFGLVDPGVKLERFVELRHYYREGAEKKAILSIQNESSYGVKAHEKGTHLEELADGTQVQVKTLNLMISANSIPDSYCAVMKATCTVDGVIDEAELSLRWSVRNLFNVEPRRVFIGSNDFNHKKLTRKVLIQREDGESFRIVECKVPTNGIQVADFQHEAAYRHSIILNIAPGAIASPFNGEILLTTDHPIQQSLKIPVAALR